MAAEQFSVVAEQFSAAAQWQKHSRKQCHLVAFALKESEMDLPNHRLEALEFEELMAQNPVRHCLLL